MTAKSLEGHLMSQTNNAVFKLFSYFALTLFLKFAFVESVSQIDEFSCDFNGKLCNQWKVDHATYTFGNIGLGSQIRLDEPISSLIQYKRYMMLKSDASGNQMKLYTNLNLESIQPRCFYFNLFAVTGQLGWINLTSYSDELPTNSIQLWSKRDYLKDAWVRAFVTLPVSTRKLEFTIEQSSMAVSVFSLKAHACNRIDFCTFEDMSVCNFIVSNPSELFNFRVLQVDPFKTTTMMPSMDHTRQNEFGHFLIANGLSPKLEKDTHSDVELTIGQLDPMPYCVSFWVIKEDEKRDNLELLMQVQQVQQQSNHHHSWRRLWNSDQMLADSQRWSLIRLTVNPSHKSRLVLRAHQKNEINNQDQADQFSTVAVDDLKVEHGECDVETGITCNFSDDLCSWTYDFSKPSLFLQGVGRLTNVDNLEYYIPLPARGMKPYVYTDFDQNRNTAAIISPLMPATQSSCFQFEYQMKVFSYKGEGVQLANDRYKNDGGIKLYMIHDTVKRELARFTKPTDYHSWKFDQKTISSDRPFRLELEAGSGPSAQLMTYLDRITYIEEEECEDVETNGAKSMVAIEILSMGCSFDKSSSSESKDFCDWKLGGDEPFRHSKYRWSTYMLPLQDATNNNLDGGFAFAHAYQLSQTQRKHAKLISPDFHPPPPPSPPSSKHDPNPVHSYCLSFYYYLHTTIGLTSLSVQLNEDINLYHSSRINWLRRWRHHRLSFTHSGSFHIEMIASLQNGDVAIDQIQLFAGECENLLLTEAECDFEIGPCNWYGQHETQGSGIASFRRLQTDHLDCGLPFVSDDRTGHVMAVDLQSRRPMTGRSRLSRKLNDFTFKHLIQDNSPLHMCLNFWANYNAKAKLHLVLSDGQFEQDVFEDDQDNREQGVIPGLVHSWPTEHAHNSWYPERVQINLNEGQVKHSLEFHLTYQEQNTGYVALDNFWLKVGSCPPNDCTFENGHCLWHNPGVGLQHFIIKDEDEQKLPFINQFTQSISGISTLGPDSDHTLGSEEGSFLLANLNAPAILRSPRIFLNKKTKTDYCVRLWASAGGSDLPAKVQLLYGFDDQQVVKEHDWAEVPPTKKWTQLQLSLHLESEIEHKTHQQLVLYLIGGSQAKKVSKDSSLKKHVTFSFSSKSWLAIDDLQLANEPCDQPEQLFTCDQGKRQILMSKVCDYVVDCQLDGQDEANCADCTFKDDLCGYSNVMPEIDSEIWESDSNPDSEVVSKLDNGWMHSKGKQLNSAFDFTVDQSIDQKSQSNQLPPLAYGALAYQVKAKEQCLLQSGHLKESSSQCAISFEFVKDSGTLELRLIPDDGDYFDIWFDKQQSLTARPERVNLLVGRVRTNFRLQFIYSQKLVDNQCLVRNVQTRNCALPQSSASLAHCARNEFLCQNKFLCLSKDVVCNFVDDCGDNSDELDCKYDLFRTDFEQGSGHWQLMGAMRLRRGFDTLDYGPGRDHSWNRKEGRYAIVRGFGSTFGALGTVRLANPFECKLRMFYMATGSSTGLWLYVQSEEDQTVSVHNVELKNDFNWNRMEIELNELGVHFPILLTIHAKSKSLYEFVALDSISFTQSCYHERPLQLQCEGNTAPIYCRWHLMHRSADIYYRLNNEDWGDFNGPQSGKYLLVKKSSNEADPLAQSPVLNQPLNLSPDQQAQRPEQSPGDFDLEDEDEEVGVHDKHTLRIQSPFIPHRRWTDVGGVYFSFQYSMSGSQPGEISLKAVGEMSKQEIPLMEVFHSKTWKWKKMCFHLPPRDSLKSFRLPSSTIKNAAQTDQLEDFRLEFTFRMPNVNSYTALNNVKFDFDQTCFDSQVCTFDEIKPCVHIMDDEDKWHRHYRIMAASEHHCKDHTTNTGFGRVVYLAEDSSVQQLSFKPFPDHQPYCVRFWILTRADMQSRFQTDEGIFVHQPLNGDTAVLGENLYYTSLANKDKFLLRIKMDSSEETLFSLSSECSIAGWRMIQVSIKEKALDHLKIEYGQEGFVLIDDLSITQESCSSPFDCHFEEDSCGWVGNQFPGYRQWIHFTPRHFTFGPRTDHSENTAKGSFMYAYFDSNDSHDSQFEIKLSSPMLFMTKHETSRCLEFAYWMRDKSSVSLMVVLWNSFQQRNLKTYTKGKDDDWILTRIDVPSLKTESVQFIDFVANYLKNEASTFYASSGVGLDSIRLYDVTCAKLQKQEQKEAEMEETHNLEEEEEEEDKKEEEENNEGKQTEKHDNLLVSDKNVQAEEDEKEEEEDKPPKYTEGDVRQKKENVKESLSDSKQVQNNDEKKTGNDETSTNVLINFGIVSPNELENIKKPENTREIENPAKSEAKSQSFNFGPSSNPTKNPPNNFWFICISIGLSVTLLSGMLAIVYFQYPNGRLFIWISGHRHEDSEQLIRHLVQNELVTFNDDENGQL